MLKQPFSSTKKKNELCIMHENREGNYKGTPQMTKGK